MIHVLYTSTYNQNDVEMDGEDWIESIILISNLY